MAMACVLILAFSVVAAKATGFEDSDKTIQQQFDYESTATGFEDPINKVRQRVFACAFPSAFSEEAEHAPQMALQFDSPLIIRQPGQHVDWLRLVELTKLFAREMLQAGLIALILVSLAVMAGAMVQTSTGLGFVMVSAPLLGLVDLAFLPGPILLADFFLSVSMLAREGRAIETRDAAPLGMGLAFGTILGALLLAQIPPDRLGVFFALLILTLVTLAALSPKVPLMRRNIIIGATGSGFTGIAAAMHGPPLALLYQHENPRKVRATLAAVYVFGSALALATLHLSGWFGVNEMRMGLILLPGVAVGFGVGRLLTGYISQKVARRSMLTISAVCGALLLAKSL